MHLAVCGRVNLIKSAANKNCNWWVCSLHDTFCTSGINKIEYLVFDCAAMLKKLAVLNVAEHLSIFLRQCMTGQYVTCRAYLSMALCCLPNKIVINVCLASISICIRMWLIIGHCMNLIGTTWSTESNAMKHCGCMMHRKSCWSMCFYCREYYCFTTAWKASCNYNIVVFVFQ